MTVVSNNRTANLAEILRGHQDAILDEWLKAMSSSIRRSDLIKESELRAQAARVLKLMAVANEIADGNLQASAWEETKDALSDITRSRAKQGFTPSETAMFIFSLKRPLFDRLRREYGN